MFCVSLMLTAVFMWGEGDDAFGDPFSGDQSLPEHDEAGVVDLSGRLSYKPVFFAAYADKKRENPVFLSNAVETVLTVGSEFGRTRFSAEFSVGVDIDGDNNPVFDIGARRLYFNYRADVLDLTIGRFAIEWSPMSVFPLSDFFSPAGMPAPGGDVAEEPATGLRAVAYVGPLTLEGVFVPLYYAPTAMTDYFGALGIDLYPDDIPVVLTDSRPGLSLGNPQGAVRLGLDIPFLDTYFYYFHGFMNQTLTTSRTEFEPPATVTLVVENVHRIVDRFGLTATLDVLGFIVNAEAVLTLGAPVHVTEEVELPIGPVTNTVLKSAPLARWSAGFEWEMAKDVRLIFEYADVEVLENVPEVNQALLGGNKVFGALDVRLPVGPSEQSLTAGAFYDWSGGGLTAVATLKSDFLNGVTVEASGIYFSVLGTTGDTVSVYAQLDNSLIFSLTATYDF